jgi:hypothetical protein
VSDLWIVGDYWWIYYFAYLCFDVYVVVFVEFGYFAFYGDWYFIDGVIYLYLDFIVEWYIITSLKWIVLLEKKFYFVFGSTVYFNQKHTIKMVEMV